MAIPLPKVAGAAAESPIGKETSFDDKWMQQKGYSVPPAQRPQPQYNPDKNLMNQAYESPYAAQFNKDVDLIRQSAAPLNVTDTVDYKRRLSQQRENRPDEYEIDRFIGNTGRSFDSMPRKYGRYDTAAQQANAMFMAGLEKDLRFGNEAARNAAEEAMYGSTAGYLGQRGRDTQLSLANLAGQHMQADSYARGNDLTFKSTQETNRLNQQKFNLDVQDKIRERAKEMQLRGDPTKSVSDYMGAAAAEFGYAGWPPPGGLGVSTTILDPGVTSSLRSMTGEPGTTGGVGSATSPIPGGLGGPQQSPSDLQRQLTAQAKYGSVAGSGGTPPVQNASVPRRDSGDVNWEGLSEYDLARRERIAETQGKEAAILGGQQQNRAKELLTESGLPVTDDNIAAALNRVRKNGRIVSQADKLGWAEAKAGLALDQLADNNNRVQVAGGADRPKPRLEDILEPQYFEGNALTRWLRQVAPSFMDYSAQGQYAPLRGYSGQSLPLSGNSPEIFAEYFKALKQHNPDEWMRRSKFAQGIAE